MDATIRRPRSDRFWLLELRVSAPPVTFYGRFVQAMDIQLCDIDGGPRRSWGERRVASGTRTVASEIEETDTTVSENAMSDRSWF